MGMFDFLFKSDRDLEAPGANKEEMDRITNLINSIGSLKSEYSDVSSLGDVKNKFGVGGFDREGYTSKIRDMFSQKRKGLATNLASNRAAIAGRMTGGEATPEFAFSPTESAYAGAMGDLGASEAGMEMGSYDKENNWNMQVAELLNSVLGKKEGFQQWKTGSQLQGEGMRSNAVENYTNSLNDDSLFSDILAGAGTAAKLGWSPFGTAKQSSSSNTSSSWADGIKDQDVLKGLSDQIRRIRQKGYTL